MVRNQDKKNSDKTNILQETVSTLSVGFGLLSLLFSLHLVDQLVIDAGYRKSLDTRRHSKCLQRGKQQKILLPNNCLHGHMRQKECGNGMRQSQAVWGQKSLGDVHSICHRYQQSNSQLAPRSENCLYHTF